MEKEMVVSFRFVAERSWMNEVDWSNPVIAEHIKMWYCDNKENDLIGLNDVLKFVEWTARLGMNDKLEDVLKHLLRCGYNCAEKIILGGKQIREWIEEYETITDDCDQDLWTSELQEECWRKVQDLYEFGEIGLVRIPLS